MDAPEMTNDTSNTHGHIIQRIWLLAVVVHSQRFLYSLCHTLNFKICDAPHLGGFLRNSNDNLYIYGQDLLINIIDRFQYLRWGNPSGG